MQESGPKPTTESDKETRRPKRKSRKAVSLGGLAANEGLIFAREKEPVPKAKKTAAEIAEALRHKTREESADDKSTEKTAADDELIAPATDEKPAAATQSEKPDAAESPEAASRETDDDMPEHDAELAELNPDETRHAMDEYVQVRGMEVAAEQVVAEPDSPEAAALEADADMLDHLRQALEADPEADPVQAADEAYQAALDALPDVEEPPADTAEDIPAEQPPRPPEQPAAEAAPDDDEEPAHVSHRATPIVPPATGPLAAEYVPTPPEQRFGPGRSVISIEEAAHYERRAETRGLLIGGLVGYFIGRRRSRIKTEKRLLPVQEKLEDQVRQLHDTVADREARLREEAARRRAKVRELAAVQASAETRPPQVVKAEVLPRAEERPAEFAPALNQPETAPNPFENLPAGPMVEVAAATAAMTAAAIEQQRAQPPVEAGTVKVDAKELAAENVKQLSVPELLAASETVVIGGERLRDIYESKRITEPGLRNVLAEYARGGDVEKVLQQEIHNKELTYERDPRMRKRLATSLSDAGGKAAGKAGQLASDAKPLLTASTERAKGVGKKVVDQTVKAARKLDNPSNPAQQVVVRTWAVTTVVLAIIALVLLFR